MSIQLNKTFYYGRYAVRTANVKKYINIILYTNTYF